MKEKYGEERHTSRIWTPIDHLNYDFVEKMQSRGVEEETKDFLIENMVWILQYQSLRIVN